jgi:tetratricopeptide (TPR) repeat protein
MRTTGDFAKSLERAWDSHSSNPRAALIRLQTQYDEITQSDEVARAARFVFHVYGVHLGEWAAGGSALRALRNTLGWAPDSDAERAIRLSLRALELAATDDDGNVDTAKLSPGECANAYALAAECLMERGEDARAVEYLDRAVIRADKAALAHVDPAVRAIAVAANNIATSFEEFPQLDAAQGDRVVLCAYVARLHWERAGGWLEIERAEYRLARSMVLAGYPALAIKHARKCLALCEENGAPALERFFGVEALIHALVAEQRFETVPALVREANTFFAQLGEQDRQYCEATMRRLTAIAQ